jgi:predicted small lipoprotein YifL
MSAFGGQSLSLARRAGGGRLTSPNSIRSSKKWLRKLEKEKSGLRLDCLFYYRPSKGVHAVVHSDSPVFRLALIAALAAAISLSACGRKGPLDPPPGASLAGQQITPEGVETRDRPILGPDGKPLAPAGANKRIPLDVLLN